MREEHRLRVTLYLISYGYCTQHAGKEICKIVGLGVLRIGC